MNKPIFIHVPKTAGSSIKQLPWIEQTIARINNRLVEHMRFSEAVTRYGVHRYYFGVIRHPVSRFISAMRHVFENKSWYKDILNEYEMSIVPASNKFFFTDFIESLSTHLTIPTNYFLFIPMVDYLDGVDRIIRFEELDKGMAELAQVYNPGHSHTGLQHINKTPEMFEAYIDQTTEDRIKKFYRQDMETYNYD